MSVFHIFHSFKEQIVVPFLAIEHNIEFTRAKEGQKVILSDSNKGIVQRWEYVHMCSNRAEELVRGIYGCDVWSFIKKWYSCQDISSLTFLYIELKKDDK